LKQRLWKICSSDWIISLYGSTFKIEKRLKPPARWWFRGLKDFPKKFDQMPIQLLIDCLGAKKKYLEWLNSFELSNQKKKTPWNSLKITIERQKGKTPDPPNKTIPSDIIMGLPPRERGELPPPDNGGHWKTLQKLTWKTVWIHIWNYIGQLGNHGLHVECLSLKPILISHLELQKIIALGSCRVLDTIKNLCTKVWIEQHKIIPLGF